MKISDEAVHAARAVSRGHYINADEHMKASLTAALPFLTGVKVKALEWVEIPSCNGMNTAKTQFGTYTIGSSLVVRYGLKSISKPLATLEAAKAAAQADYEARVLSAIEVAPSPRAQALDIIEAIFKDLRDRRFLKWLFDERGDKCLIGVFKDGSEVRGIDLEAQQEIRGAWQDIIARALSSQPVADGWLPIETAPKDGTSVEVYDSFITGKDGFAQVIARHDKEHGWHVAASVVGGIYIKLTNPTHWRPLPASPGASVTRPTGGSNHEK